MVTYCGRGDCDFDFSCCVCGVCVSVCVPTSEFWHCLVALEFDLVLLSFPLSSLSQSLVPVLVKVKEDEFFPIKGFIICSISKSKSTSISSFTRVVLAMEGKNIFVLVPVFVFRLTVLVLELVPPKSKILAVSEEGLEL